MNGFFGAFLGLFICLTRGGMAFFWRFFGRIFLSINAPRYPPDSARRWPVVELPC